MEKKAKIERELREKYRSGGPLKITAKSLKSMKFDCVEFEKSLLSFMPKITKKRLRFSILALSQKPKKLETETTCVTLVPTTRKCDAGDLILI